MALNGQWVELFRAGDYADKGAYSSADIDRMISNYDPAKHEAPVVIGHPEHNAPAYGWVESLKRSGPVLMGKLKQAQPEFEELVRKGLFKKRSISFYVTKNGPSLRHVGFLGAMPPEVKGLADVKLASFSSGEFQAIEFKEEDQVDVKEISQGITDSLKQFFSEFFKGNKFSDSGADDHGAKIGKAVSDALKPLQDQHDALQAKHDALKKQLDDQNKSSADAKSQSDSEDYAESQMLRVKNAKAWIPAFEKMGASQIFAELAKIQNTVTFGEGDKKVEKKPAEALADFMISLGKIVPMGELAGQHTRTTGNLVKFTESKTGASVDERSVALAEAATKLSKEKNIPYGQALTQVRQSGEFEHAGSSAAGAV